MGWGENQHKKKGEYKMEQITKYVEDNVESLAESHVEVWYERYEGETIESIEYDLNVNHDHGIEVELAEEELGRELTGEEEEYLVAEFNDKVVSLIEYHRENGTVPCN